MNTKPLPEFSLPAPEPPRWTLIAMSGDISRPATLDDLRAVVRMLPPDGHGLGPGGSLVRATLVRDIENAVEVEKQAQSFARRDNEE